MESTLKSKQTIQFFTAKFRNTIVDIIVYLFIALFVYTASSKLMTMTDFQIILSRSPLTGPYSVIISWGVPIGESFTAALLLIPGLRRTGLILSLATMVSFTAFLLYGVLSGSTLPCHCGGVISSMSWTQHIFFNTGFILLAVTGLFLHRN